MRSQKPMPENPSEQRVHIREAANAALRVLHHPKADEKLTHT